MLETTTVTGDYKRSYFVFSWDFWTVAFACMAFAVWAGRFVYWARKTSGYLKGDHECVAGSKKVAANDLDSIANEHLAELQRRVEELLTHIHTKHINTDGTLRERVMVRPDGTPCDSANESCSNPVDITCAVIRLLQKHHKHTHYPSAGLRMSEYDNDDDDILAVNEDKGVHMRVCVFKKGERKAGAEPERMNVLMRVMLHELAHTMHCVYVRKKDHGRHFYRLERYLMHVGTAQGLYTCPKTQDGSMLHVCGRSLPLSSLCSNRKKTQRQPSSSAIAQDSAPVSAQSMAPGKLLRECSSRCSVQSRIMSMIPF